MTFVRTGAVTGPNSNNNGQGLLLLRCGSPNRCDRIREPNRENDAIHILGPIDHIRCSNGVNTHQRGVECAKHHLDRLLFFAVPKVADPKMPVSKGLMQLIGVKKKKNSPLL